VGAVIPVPGGVLIKNATDEIIGAVGISGDHPENDEAMARSIPSSWWGWWHSRGESPDRRASVMKLATFVDSCGPRIGVVEGQEVADVVSR